MIVIDFKSAYSYLENFALNFDFKFAFSFVIALFTIESFLSISVKSLREEKLKVSISRILAYLSVCSFLCALSVIEANDSAKIFPNVKIAIISNVVLAFVLVGIYLILFFCIKGKVIKEKKNYVAKVKEEKESLRRLNGENYIKVYPLKTEKLMQFSRNDLLVNFNEAKNRLESLERLCYDEQEKQELLRLNERAKFLEGVMITKDTLKDFNELFLDVVKFSSRFDSEKSKEVGL